MPYLHASVGTDCVVTVQATMKLKKEEKDRLSAWLADLDKENDVLRCVHVCMSVRMYMMHVCVLARIPERIQA